MWWTQTSRLSIKNSLSAEGDGAATPSLFGRGPSLLGPGTSAQHPHLHPTLARTLALALNPPLHTLTLTLTLDRTLTLTLTLGPGTSAQLLCIAVGTAKPADV